MNDLLLSNTTLTALNKYTKNPGQSVVLVGSKWISKSKTADYLIAKLLEMPAEKLINYPYIRKISSLDNKKIGIDEIRSASSLLNLKVASIKHINRIILINDAELMSAEAQNALLKDLEEPPEGTIFILTTTTLNALLPTITSRMQVVNLVQQDKETLFKHYTSEGHSKTEIDTAYNMSGGQSGLMDLLLEDEDHPLNKATKLAKELLQGSRLDKLSLVNELAKDKTELSYFFFILKEMAKIGIKSNNSTTSKRWQHILSASLRSETMLSSNTQTKLTLTNFILSIG